MLPLRSQLPSAQINGIKVQDRETTNEARARGTPNPDAAARGDNIQIVTELPPYSEMTDLPFEPSPKTRSPIDKKIDWNRMPEGIPGSMLQASIEGAFHVAAENYFKGGAFARAMN